MKYKGKEIPPYESFYWNDSEDFFRGFLGGGISRTVKCDDSLAVIVEYEQEIAEDDYEQPHPQYGGGYS